MAGTIIADTIQATSQQISLNVGNTTILTASSTGLTLIPTTNVNINVTNSTVAFGSGNVTRPSISFSGNTSTGMYMPLANTIAWTVAGSEAMRFDSSGNLGIGTNSPSYRLDVVGAGSPANGIVRASSHLNNNSTKYGYYTVGHYTNSVAPFGFIQGESNSTENNVHIGSGAGETTAATRIDFYTASNNTTTGGTERMRIISSGQVGINATPASGNTFRVINIGSDNACQFGNASSGVYLPYASPTAWSSYSDSRLKDVIGNYENALEHILQLNPIKYTWKSDTNKKVNIGLLAQNVLEVVPEIVDENTLPNDEEDQTKYLSLRYTDLIPVLIGSIQELKVIVDAQAVEIAALKAK